MALRQGNRHRDSGGRRRFRSGEEPSYRDGNKRIGFLAIATFLGIHGYDFKATDAEVVTPILALADRRISEEQLADWIRARNTSESHA